MHEQDSTPNGIPTDSGRRGRRGFLMGAAGLAATSVVAAPPHRRRRTRHRPPRLLGVPPAIATR